MKLIHVSLSLTHALALTAAAAVAVAQEAPAGGAAPGADGPAGSGVTVIQLPPSAPHAPYDPDAHLSSSSHSLTDIGKGDSFDLGSKSGGPVSVHGTNGGTYVVDGQFTPEGHSVRRGETLWEIAARYYQTPYQWPRVWAYNPQIQNPHWIYPGDRVRLREEGSGSTRGNVGFGRKGRAVPPQTLFLRDMGWIDDRAEDTWGELVASPEDHMMLDEGEDVYIQLKEGHDPAIGEQLTIFRPIRTIDSKNAKGELVSIRGTVRVDRYNPKTHMVRARIIECIDTIERGVRVGPVGRKFDIVPPVVAEDDVEAGILAALWPYSLYAQHMVVFLDRGSKDNVKIGQRFFAVRRGDRWQQAFPTAGVFASAVPRVGDDLRATFDNQRTHFDEGLLPDETYAELRVVRVREHTSVAMVTASKHEIERGARLVSRKGL